MTNFQAIVLGVLQGAGEFLPISSSAHLAIAPRLFGWEYQGLAYDVMLHLGTLLAVLIYFARDWLKIFRDAITAPRSPEGRMLWLLALASVPAGAAGLLLNDYAETVFRDPLWIAFNLVFFSFVIYAADRKPAQALDESAFSPRHALLIGLAQCVALMPGASRSGMTIMAARPAQRGLRLGPGRLLPGRPRLHLAADGVDEAAHAGAVPRLPRSPRRGHILLFQITRNCIMDL